MGEVTIITHEQKLLKVEGFDYLPEMIKPLTPEKLKLFLEQSISFPKISNSLSFLKFTVF